MTNHLPDSLNLMTLKFRSDIRIRTAFLCRLGFVLFMAAIPGSKPGVRSFFLIRPDTNFFYAPKKDLPPFLFK